MLLTSLFKQDPGHFLSKHYARSAVLKNLSSFTEGAFQIVLQLSLVIARWKEMTFGEWLQQEVHGRYLIDSN